MEKDHDFSQIMKRKLILEWHSNLKLNIPPYSLSVHGYDFAKKFEISPTKNIKSLDTTIGRELWGHLNI